VPREAEQRDQRAARAARLLQSYDRLFDTVRVRTAYRCRAYPGAEQQQVLNRTFGCVRVVWNRTLAARRARWQAERTATSYAQTDAALTTMKKDPDLAFLNEVSSVPLQQALRHQHQAFTAFFPRRARYPRFKSRRGRQAAHYTRRAFSLRGGELRLAKTAGPLRFTWSWPEVDVDALDPTMVVVSREPDGRWYVTFAIDTDTPEPLKKTGHAVGIDLGVTDFAVTSDGERIANPRHLARKARNLAATGMVRNRHLARAIADCGWAEFRRQLVCKCERYGRNLVVIDRWYPSSKTCSACGHRLAGLSLGTRQWTCPSCGTRHDRDLNAATNILAAGQAVTACGAGVRHPGTPRVQPTVKQEPQPVRAGISVPQGGE
jgi:putative transposase